jgi:hypothetical protein
MYQSNTIRQCLWLITTIRQNGRITLKKLQEKWTDDMMGDVLYRQPIPNGLQGEDLGIAQNPGY